MFKLNEPILEGAKSKRRHHPVHTPHQWLVAFGQLRDTQRKGRKVESVGGRQTLKTQHLSLQSVKTDGKELQLLHALAAAQDSFHRY